MRHVKYILVDEMSFIGKNLLKNIDSRLWWAFLENGNIPFGKRSTILVGDFGKFPSVMEPTYACDDFARESWNSFTKVVMPYIVFQQDGKSNKQIQFCHLLMNVITYD